MNAVKIFQRPWVDNNWKQTKQCIEGASLKLSFRSRPGLRIEIACQCTIIGKFKDTPTIEISYQSLVEGIFAHLPISKRQCLTIDVENK